LFTLYRKSHADHATPSDCSAEVPHWETLELCSLGMGGVADADIYAPPRMCYHVKFGTIWFATKGVRKIKGTLRIEERRDPAQLRWGVANHLKQVPTPYVLHVKFCVEMCMHK